MNHDEMLRCIYHVFHPSLPRLGPGDTRSTQKAIEILRPHLGPEPLNILDLGCGNGAQTLILAEFLPGRVTAVDTHQPFLEELNRRAIRAAVAEKIENLCVDMGSPDLPSGAYDLVWCEGALYNLGLDAGLRQGFRLLSPGGCMAFTELNWLSDKRSEACQDFFDQVHLPVIDVSANLAHIRDVGFREIEHFTLPAESWWSDFYRPLQGRLAELKGEAARDEKLAEVIKGLEAEIEVFLTHYDEFGYVFYLLQKP